MKSKKIVFVGTPSTGVSTFLYRVYCGAFPEIIRPTYSEALITFTECDGETVELQLWDTPCQEDYDAIRPLIYPGTDVFVICYSFLKPDSMDEIASRWYPEIISHCEKATIIVLGLRNSNINAEIPEIVKRFLSSHDRPHYIADSFTGNGIDLFLVDVARLGIDPLYLIKMKKAMDRQRKLPKNFCRI